MKKISSLLTLTTTALLATSFVAFADDAKPKAEDGKPKRSAEEGGPKRSPEEGKPGRPGGEKMDPEARLKVMTERLELTPDQQGKIKEIFQKTGPEMKALIAKGRENLSEDDKAKMKQLMQAQREEIASVLTPEQAAKMKEGRGGKPGDAPKK